MTGPVHKFVDVMMWRNVCLLPTNPTHKEKFDATCVDGGKITGHFFDKSRAGKKHHALEKNYKSTTYCFLECLNSQNLFDFFQSTVSCFQFHFAMEGLSLLLFNFFNIAITHAYKIGYESLCAAQKIFVSSVCPVPFFSACVHTKRCCICSTKTIHHLTILKRDLPHTYKKVPNFVLEMRKDETSFGLVTPKSQVKAHN